MGARLWPIKIKIFILSTKNKEKYTKLDFKPSIEEFKNLIQSVKNNTFKKEDFSNNIDIRKKLIDKKIITIFPYISELIEEEKKTRDNKTTNQIQLEIENILNDRIISKNTLANPELYFQTLLNIYLETFHLKIIMILMKRITSIKNMIVRILNLAKIYISFTNILLIV